MKLTCMLITKHRAHRNYVVVYDLVCASIDLNAKLVRVCVHNNILFIHSQKYRGGFNIMRCVSNSVDIILTPSCCRFTIHGVKSTSIFFRMQLQPLQMR